VSVSGAEHGRRRLHVYMTTSVGDYSCRRLHSTSPRRHSNTRAMALLPLPCPIHTLLPVSSLPRGRSVRGAACRAAVLLGGQLAAQPFC
jgi:hypothetical protein